MESVKNVAKEIIILLIAGMLLEYAIDPAVPFIPHAPFILFSILATAISIIFLMFILYGIWWFFKGLWRLLSKQETRSALWSNIRYWQPTRSVFAFAIMLTYILAQYIFIVTIPLMIPREQLKGVATPEQVANLALVIIVPPIILMFITLVLHGYGQLQTLRKQWQSGNRNRKMFIVAQVGLFAGAVTILTIGSLLGWNERLWFNNR